METKKENKIEKVLDKIEALLREFDSETGEKQSVTESIILHAIIWGSQNGYEGLGILEDAKSSWKDIFEDTK